MEVIICSYIIKMTIILSCAKVLAEGMGIFKKKFNRHIFLYFTNLSILVCLIFYIVDLMYIFNGNTENIILLNGKGAVLIYTLITMMVYNFILVPQYYKDRIERNHYLVTDLLAHCIIPLLTLIDWIFLSHRYYINILTPIVYLIFPIIYCVFIMIRGASKIGNPFSDTKSYYPYFFLNLEKNGVSKTLGHIAILILIFLILGYILNFINNNLLI
jgi:hypothetical protein